LVLAALILPALVLADDPVLEALSGDPPTAEAQAARTIETESSQVDDRRIRERLAGIYAEIDALQDIDVEVSSGVVRLSGSVDAQATSARAEQLARQVEGVVDVENGLGLNRALEDRLESTGNQLVELFRSLLAGLPLFGVALAVFLLFWLAGRWIRHRQGLYRRFSPNVFIAELLGQITHLLFIVLGLVLALNLLDATALLGTILGAAGILGLALGFAVRDTVENYIASILLSIRNPFGVNDLVDVDGQTGNVIKLTSRATILLSPEGNHVRIPNATVYKAIIINYTRRPERRFEFDVGVDTEHDLREAQNVATETLRATPGVQDEPPVLVIIQALGDSSVVLRCYGWVDQRRNSFAKVQSEAIRRVKEAFDEAGIVMPEPVYRLKITEGVGTAALDPVPDARPSRPSSTASGDTDPTPAPSITEESPGDVAPDRTLEARIIEEARADDGDNLLSERADREL
jgi:small-conductance mechanosensitive channel